MKKSSENPMIFVSYFCGIKGMVMAEWADDKLRVLASLERKVYVITSLYSVSYVQGNITYFKVPSLSWNDFKREILEFKNRNNRLSIWHYMLLPFAYIFGKLYDLLTKKWINDGNPARWSWALTCLPIVIFIKFRYKCKKIFCTGGAAGAQLLGVLVSKLCTIKLYLEFQDPIIGAEIHRSYENEVNIIRLENHFINASSKTVYVTKEAAKSASKRHPELVNKIHGIYPGSWQFFLNQNEKRLNQLGNFEFVHLGTLYGSRNLNNFFIALDQLVVEGFPNAENVKVKNIGSININPRSIYANRKEFESVEILNRVDALSYCSRSDMLLLVQHSDARSFETIPYKTYDYFNLNMPIFGIVNNPELEENLTSLNHYCANSTSVDSIKNQIAKILTSKFGPAKIRSTFVSPYNITEQFSQIIDE
jgi:hypothetical protein